MCVWGGGGGGGGRWGGGVRKGCMADIPDIFLGMADIPYMFVGWGPAYVTDKIQGTPTRIKSCP